MMHRFKTNPITIEENLEWVGKGLHNVKKTFFVAEHDNLRTAFKRYDSCAATAPVSLETLHPLWKVLPTDTKVQKKLKTNKSDCCSSLYGSSRPFVNKHWEALKAANGGRVLMCPICGLTECEEMDHYMPRSIFQEYSSHVNNLIPLCHSCNHDKQNDRTDRRGNRYFFNAFYDRLPANIIECKISMCLGFPKISVYISPTLDKKDYYDAIVLRTISKLELLGKFQANANDFFRREIIRLIEDYSIQKALFKHDRQAFWNTRIKSFKSYISSPDGFNFLHKKIFETIIGSSEMKDWVLNSKEFVK